MEEITQLAGSLGLRGKSPPQRRDPYDDDSGSSSSSQEPREIPYEYRYRRVPDENVIRILTINPGRWNDNLVGSLEFADLDDDPEYEALSYTWGDPFRCRKMLVDGKVFPLTQSLSDALRTVRRRKHLRRLWVDQICINQRGAAERAQQVTLMNTIYKKTKMVLVFLGNDEERVARKAMDLVLHLKEMFEDEEQLSHFTEMQREGLDKLPVGGWQYIKQLCSTPWFDRMWIGQEIGTAAPAKVFWGDATMDWQTLYEVFYILMKNHKPLRARLRLHVNKVTYLHHRFNPELNNANSNRWSFIHELHRARPRQATDPRDHVFALLGHFSAPIKAPGIPLLTADYGKSEVEVFHEVAVRMLTYTENLELLHAVQHRCHNLFECSKDIPSWAPNWGQGHLHYILGHKGTIFRTSKDWPPILRLSKWSKVMDIEGLKIDVVTQCSAKLEKEMFSFDISTNGNNSIIRSIWTNICRYSVFDLSHKYVNGESAVFAFLQTFSAGCLVLALKRGHQYDYDEVSKSIWLADGAACLMQAFGHTNLVNDQLERVSKGGDAHGWIGCSSNTSGGRRFFRTAEGYYGIGPLIVEEGDVICVLLGGRTPFILRPVGDDYSLVGECYVHGFMHGEAIEMMERGERELENFVIH
ncbi:related to heterokaryon incompatibility protein het-6 [Phialocephala subalpina]|uniref:Related to heterokaryon incompatibility protein het-6 n=1 Tax=Phialocephala subalpina TaxID=576137 RepID=A0A1L7XVS9_9HELO|nr:related to heterokaryon incompatibility protein het-6 [Phialocephala subalpina]